jgi:putative SOS response-associated peptidase YedK
MICRPLFLYLSTKFISMCNFMGTRVTVVQFIRLKEIEKSLGTLAAMEELEKMKDGFRYSNSVVIRKAGNNDIEAVSMHWEFIPVWVKTMEEVKAARKQGIPWLNATSEKLLESKMFRNAALKRRCLVLASHFFDWRHFKPEGAKKDISYPYLIEVADAPYFYMAGIWQPWTDKETGETMDTFAIVTTKANKLMEAVHNTKKRMPTILTEDLAYEWIMNDLSEERIKEIAAYQLPSQKMVAHTIAKDFKTAEDPLAEFKYEELPAISMAV